MTKILIGYCGPKEKWERMKWDEFVAYAKTKNVELVWIDLDKSIEDQGEFKLIIHKMTYMMQGRNFDVNPQLSRLYEFSKRHPEVRFIDDFDSVAITLDREETNATFEAIHWPEGCIVNIPHATLLHDSSNIKSIETATKSLNFPLLVKPKCAMSSAAAHMMKVTTTKEQILNVPTPTMLQEYINHNGVVFKVYALGDILEVGVRPSSRNIENGESVNIDFNSQKMTENNGFWTEQRDLSSVKIPFDDFARISKILRKAFNMELIGFDILIDQQDHYWIVDLNYFPGFKNIPDLWEKFLNFFLKEIERHNSH